MPRMGHCLAALAAGSTMHMAGHAQWQFELDTTFHTEIIRLHVADVRPIGDTCVFLSGSMRFPGDMFDRGSVRLLQDGLRDTSFPTFPQTTGGDKIVAWNDRFYVGTGLVRRMTPEGLIDPTFVSLNSGPYFASLQGGGYHVFPDGRVLLSGSHVLSDSIRGFEGLYDLIWFTNTGYLDTTRIHRKGNGVVFRFAEMPDGKFICASTCTEFEGEPVDWFFRVHADGTTDTTFHTGVFWGDAYDYLPLNDGRCYVGGSYRRTQAPNDTIRLARFMPDGSIDLAFSIPLFALNGLPNNGLGVSPTGFGPQVWSSTPWGGGRLIVTGYFGSVNGQSRGGICMLDSLGAVLDAFDGCWTGPFTYQNYHYGAIRGFVPVGDGEHFYIYGSYIGFDDGTANDTLQRFVSRLRLVDTPMVAIEHERMAFRCYPNPASASCSFELDELPPQAMLVMRDAFGREVLRQAVRTFATTLDLKTLPEGVYTIELRTGEQRLLAQRLIIQH